MRHLWTPSRIVSVIAYAVLGICIIVLFASDARQDEFDAQRGREIAAANEKTVKCLVKALSEDASQTKELRGVSSMRDEDLEATVRAMIVMVEERVVEGVHQNDATDQAARQFIVQGTKFLEESKVLREARKQNQVPKEICGVKIDSEPIHEPSPKPSALPKSGA
jgi:hypothetical protein